MVFKEAHAVLFLPGGDKPEVGVDAADHGQFACGVQEQRGSQDHRVQVKFPVDQVVLEEGSCHYSEKTTDGNGKPIPGEPIVEDEDTGLDRIPAYVIVNDGLSGDTDGESDVETIMDDDSWYSKMRSANLDSLRKSMNQVIWTSGVKPESFEKFTNAPGSIWDIEADPAQASASSNAAQVQVGTISNSFSYTSAYDGTLGNLKQEMYDALGIPDINLETMRSIITSGKAMKAIYWPLICRCEEKMTAWRPALEWLTELILYAGEVFPSLRQRYGEFRPAEHIVSIDNQYPLPEDEESERTLDMQEVSSQNRSRKSYLMKWGGDGYRGMTAEQADEELRQMPISLSRSAQQGLAAAEILSETGEKPAKQSGKDWKKRRTMPSFPWRAE